MKATLSKNSWHYKFNRRMENSDFWSVDATDQVSLCNYAWSTVFNLIVALALSALLYVFSTGLGAGILASNGVDAGELTYWYLYIWFLGVAVFAGVVAALLGIGFTIYILNEKYQEYKYDKYEKGLLDDKPKQKSLISQWIKAKKDKVCPMIDWEE
ncbi:TMhelix containing protein [Vibrio phage 1.170.O._10N.261.52.C3]|nr:TMhelix containing protein [Vibrio phage 1.170.O._10N.261.52.C3]